MVIRTKVFGSLPCTCPGSVSCFWAHIVLLVICVPRRLYHIRDFAPCFYSISDWLLSELGTWQGAEGTEVKEILTVRKLAAVVEEGWGEMPDGDGDEAAPRRPPWLVCHECAEQKCCRRMLAAQVKGLGLCDSLLAFSPPAPLSLPSCLCLHSLLSSLVYPQMPQGQLLIWCAFRA